MRDFKLLGALELFVRFGRRQRVVHRQARSPQVMDQLQGLGAQGLIFDQAKGVEGSIEFRQQRPGFEQFQQHHVAHAEAQSRQVHFAAADEFDEVVVTASSGDGAKFPFAVERLEYDPGVIGQTPYDVVIDLDELMEPARSEVLQDHLQFGRGFSFLDEG